MRGVNTRKTQKAGIASDLMCVCWYCVTGSSVARKAGYNERGIGTCDEMPNKHKGRTVDGARIAN